MKKIHREILSILIAALLATAGSLAAQGAAGQAQPQNPSQEQAKSQPAAPARSTGPQITGTVVLWNGDRLDLKTADGKTHKIAVNRGTQRLADIATGARLTVDYHRKVGGFIIAERVRPDEQSTSGATGSTTASSAPAQGASPAAPALTGAVVSWNNSALIVRTKEGDATFFLAPTTEYLVKSLDPGSQVIVEYSQGADGAKLATRVRAAQATQAKKKDGR
jgi:hypothetical protein